MENHSIVIGAARLELSQGDITKESLEAIGNAANSHLAGGGGVDGAIHRAGGPSIMAELKSQYPQGCPTGSAVITGAGKLNVKYVIHAVGPVYSGNLKDAQLLASVYEKSLELCSRNHIKSIAFPSISTGVYGYPADEAAPIALRATADYMRNHAEISKVRFVLFDIKTSRAYRRALNSITDKQPCASRNTD